MHLNPILLKLIALFYNLILIHVNVYKLRNNAFN